MTPLLGAIGRRAPLVLAIGVLLGMVLPGLGAIIGPVFPVLIVMLLAVAMIRVDLPQVLSHLRQPLRLGLMLFFLMAVIPLVIHALAVMFGLSPALHTALVLMACAPPLAASPGIAALLGLDDALTLNVMVVGTLIVPLSAPILIVTLLDLPVDLDADSLLLRLVLTIGVALAAAIAIRRGVGRRRIEEHSDVLDGISALIMVVFAIVVMNGIGLAQMQNPGQIANVLGAVLLANWGLHAMTGMAFFVFRVIRKTALSTQDGAIALMAGNRNIALFLAALPTETSGLLFLFLALYQLPIYLSPILAAPLYRRLLSR